MAKLIYVANMSLDGYTEDRHGNFDFTVPNDEVFAFITDIVRPMGTSLYGRRMYETMAVWETDPSLADVSELRAEFARVWQSSDKVVYSSTLEETPTLRTRIERTFDAGAVRAMKDAATADLIIGGPTITAVALAAGLVDECHLFVAPVALGGGKAAFNGGVRVNLELEDERRFGDAVYLRYSVEN